MARLFKRSTKKKEIQKYQKENKVCIKIREEEVKVLFVSFLSNKFSNGSITQK